LERYCVTILEAERIKAALRKPTPGNDQHARLARFHRQAVALAAMLATKLRRCHRRGSTGARRRRATPRWWRDAQHLVHAHDDAV
jgi:hypothetical protein